MAASEVVVEQEEVEGEATEEVEEIMDNHQGHNSLVRVDYWECLTGIRGRAI